MRHVVFYDRSFPYPGERPPEPFLARLSGEATLTDADGLNEALAGGRTACLVMLHGPYFPKASWAAIADYLRGGGGLIVVGGAPFKAPVVREQGGWREIGEMTGYHQRLHIHEALPVDPAPIARLEANPDLPLFAGKESLLRIAPTYGLVLHVSKQRDIPAESGSNGPMDARIYPLLRGVSASGREVAAPAVLLEHTSGDYAGGRWLLLNQRVDDAFWTERGLAALLEWAGCCALGVTELWVKPGYACYTEGERAGVRLQAQRIRGASRPESGGPGADDRPSVRWTFRLALTLDRGDSPNDGGPDDHSLDDRSSNDDCPNISGPADAAPAAVWSAELTLAAGDEIAHRALTIPVELKPGLYLLTAEAFSERGERRILRQGFWCRDDALLKSGAPVVCGRDYFVKDSRPLPVVGMTYMTSDVSRKFVFLPNPAVWRRDMDTMRRAGINWLRTGLWTAWRQMMFADGHASEEALRAIDAFLLTAKRCGLEVTFTFFAFTPEAWDGANPYLDRRSIEAQKRFIRAIALRHRETTNVNWDFINEPSLFDPARIFTGPRSNGDRLEREAFGAWLRERHGEIGRLQDRWNMTPDELPDFASAALPEPEEISFDIENMRLPRKNNRWLDFNLFVSDMHNRWVREMKRALADMPLRQLVTVGQDEALGRGPRPSPFFYAAATDYTTVHTWWLNDQLVWDSVFAKAPDKPMLVQETGIMYLETPDNRAKRSEDELRRLLERKYAYAFGTGGAGAVQWLWNTNYFMNNANESNIGALRADGTEKPEADVSYDFGTFMNRIRDLFAARELEDIVVVFPYSNDYSSRRFAFDATARAARTLAYELKAPFRGLGEYQLDSLADDRPKLIVVPSPHNFADEALTALVEHVERAGGTLLFTGPLGLDAYWRPTDRLTALTGPRALSNVLREETLIVGGEAQRVSFGHKRIGEVSAERPAGPGADRSPFADALSADTPALETTIRPLGKGRFVWCPLPLELGDRTEPLAALYRLAIRESGASASMRWVVGGDAAGVFGSLQSYAGGHLFVFVSEQSQAARIEVENTSNGMRYGFKLERESAVLFATGRDGELLASYKDAAVEVLAREGAPS